MSEPRIPNETDVVVVGSGAAGLVCALVAAVEGLRVIVVEKSEKLGSTSAMPGGAVWVPANHLGRDAGVPDNPAAALAYLRAPTIEQLAKKAGLPPVPLRETSCECLLVQSLVNAAAGAKKVRRTSARRSSKPKPPRPA